MRKHKKRGTRILSLVLTMAMVFTMLPSTALATEGEGTLDGSKLACHVTHDKDCSYQKALEGVACFHKTEDGSYNCISDSVSDNKASLGDADKYTCNHEDDCDYTEAVAGVDCTHSCDICKPLETENANNADFTNCKGADGKNAAVKFTYEQVVELFTALPAASVINRTTTQEEKDTIIAQLAEAMDAVDALTAEEQALFLNEQQGLYAAAMALNDAITGAKPVTMATVTEVDGTTLTLHKALEDAADGAILKLIKDITLTSTIYTPFGTAKNLTIDLNGTILDLGGYEFNHYNDGTLTIMDGSVGATGKITSTSYALSVNDVGTAVNIISGTLESTGSDAIYITGNCPVNITGGTVRTTAAGKCAISSFDETSKITISEANPLIPTLITSVNTGENSGTIYIYAVPINDPKIVLEVQGGTISNTASPIEGYSVCFDKTNHLDSSNVAGYYQQTGGTVGRVNPPLPVINKISFDPRNGDVIADAEIGDDGTITMPVQPTWGGYDFGGWYTDKDGNGTEVTKDTVLSASTTVYAKWTKGGKTVYTKPIDLTGTPTLTSGDGWSWDTTNKILTLDGVNIDCYGDVVTTGFTAVKLPEATTINLVAGTVNTVKSANVQGNVRSEGVKAAADLTINGTGELQVSTSDNRGTSGADNGYNYTIFVSGKLTINSGTIRATAGRAYNTSMAIYGNSVEINGGNVHATSRETAFTKAKGIEAYTGLVINDGIVKVTSDEIGLNCLGGITLTGGVTTVNVGSGKKAFTAKSFGSSDQMTFITAEDATVTGTTETFVSGTNTLLTQSGTAPVVISFGPSITTATQTGTATYGTAANPTFVVTNSNFGGNNPAFAPTIAWTSGTTPKGVTTSWSADKGTLTVKTTATTPTGEHKFKVVSPKKAPETGNYESAEATLKVDKLEATITWGTTTSFPYNASAQAPTATVANKVGTDAVTVTVTGGETNVGTNHTATADALAGAAAGNYELPTTKPTQTFAITAKSLTVTDGDLEIKKAYDANKTAGTVTAGKLGLTGVVATDTANVSVKVDTIGDYADANVGKNKTVTLTISLDGTAKANYTLGSTTTYTFQKAEITKVAYTGTKADAPSSTPTAKTDKSITLASVTPPTGEGVQYAKSTTNTAPTSDADWQDSTTFSGLTPNTEYFFFARVKEGTNHAPGGESTGTSITTDKANYTGTQATAPSNTPTSKSADTITLASVTTPTGKDIQYAISTTATAPTSDSDWQDSVSFTGLDADKEYYFFARVKENATHKAGKASTGTKIKTDLSNEQKVAVAKAIVEKALNAFKATNNTDANSVIAALNKALNDAGITGVTPSFDPTAPFAITKADEDNTGTITGTIKLECGSGGDAKSDTTTLNKTIPQLPSDPKEKVKLVKAAIQAALKAYTATNATTDADIKKIADDANTASGVTGVTIAWGTPAFQNTNSTDAANGKVTGTLNLSCTKAGVTATDKVSVNCPIERSDAQKLAGAILDANKAKNSVSIDARPASSVPSGKKFVTAAAQQKLTDAIAAAQAVADNTSATDAEIKAATTALQNAIKNFKASIQTGTYTEPSNDNNTSSNDSGSSSSTPSTGSTSPVAPTTPPAKPGIEVPGLVGQDGKVNVIITDQNMQDAIAKAIAEAKKNGTTDKGLVVTIYVTTGKQNGNIAGGTTGNTIPNIVPNTVTVSLPKTVQETVITSNISNTVVVVDRPDIAINMNLATIHEIYRQAQSDVQLSATRMDNNLLSMEARSAIGNRPAFDLSATYADGSKSVTNFGVGLVTVEIPYTLQEGENASDICAVYVDEKGKVSVFTNSVYDTKAKVLRFVTNHFSIYGVANKAGKQFPEATFLTALTSYTVQKGDSFWKIARKQKCNMFELAKVNGKNIFQTIYIGEVLTIPQK